MYEIIITEARESFWSCLTLADYIQTITLLLAVLVIVISISSLNHAKRSSLVKEIYVPILDEIKESEKIGLRCQIPTQF